MKEYPFKVSEATTLGKISPHRYYIRNAFEYCIRNLTSLKNKLAETIEYQSLEGKDKEVIDQLIANAIKESQ